MTTHSPLYTKATILLVDDEPMVLKMLRTFLESQNYCVICASGGQEALAVIEQQQQTIDLLLTDIRMPDMNGIRLLEAIHQLLPSLPVLLMTGYTDFDLVVEGLKQRAFDLLFKPIDFEQLNWCISRAMAFLMTERLEQQYRTRLEEQVARQTQLLCSQLEELQEAQRKAAEVDELKREFLSLISHELRTPLNGIMGSIQLMEMNESCGNQGQYLSLLKTATEKMAGLVNNLLTLVEARSSSYTIADRVSTPCKAAESIKRRYRSKADSAGISFSTDCSDLQGLTLQGPWDALYIIAGCLLDNAFTYTGRGGTVHCNLYAKLSSDSRQKASVLLQVQDNGTGIPLSSQEVIFQPFTQLEHYLTRRNNGSGIGLAIVRSLCDKLNATLNLESSPEQGSCFSCNLPFTVVQEPAP